MQSPINIAAVRTAHRKFLTAHRAAVAEETRESGKTGVEYVRTRPKFKPRTGTLQKKTGYRVIRTSNGALVLLQNPVAYAAAIDKGARPHGIKPRRAHRLVFFWEKKGVWVHARRVHHPGNKPYRFLHGATWVAGRWFERSMLRRMAVLGRSF